MRERIEAILARRPEISKTAPPSMRTRGVPLEDDARPGDLGRRNSPRRSWTARTCADTPLLRGPSSAIIVFSSNGIAATSAARPRYGARGRDEHRDAFMRGRLAAPGHSAVRAEAAAPFLCARLIGGCRVQYAARLRCCFWHRLVEGSLFYSCLILNHVGHNIFCNLSF